MRPQDTRIVNLGIVLGALLYGCSAGTRNEGKLTRNLSDGPPAGGHIFDRTAAAHHRGPGAAETQAVPQIRRSELAEFLWNPPPEDVARSRLSYGALVLGLHSTDVWAELVTRAESVQRPVVWASAVVDAGYNTGTIREDGLEKMAKADDGKALRPIMPAPPMVVLILYRTTDEIGMLTNVSADALKDREFLAWDAITAHEPLKEFRTIRISLVDESHDAWARHLAPPTVDGPSRIRALIPYDSWDGWSFAMLQSQRAGSAVSLMGRNIENRDDPDGEEATAALRGILGAAREIELHSSPPLATQPDE